MAPARAATLLHWRAEIDGAGGDNIIRRAYGRGKSEQCRRNAEMRDFVAPIPSWAAGADARANR